MTAQDQHPDPAVVPQDGTPAVHPDAGDLLAMRVNGTELQANGLHEAACVRPLRRPCGLTQQTAAQKNMKKQTSYDLTIKDILCKNSRQHVWCPYHFKLPVPLLTVVFEWLALNRTSRSRSLCPGK